MEIVYFYQYFSTPKGGWGTRVYEFARRWVEAGHSVTVVTSVYQKSDLKVTRLIEDQEIDGIRVKVINIGIDNRHGFARRVLAFIAYSIISSYYAISLRADLVVASSGPITAGIPGLVARYLRLRRLVFEVRDLWPDVPIALGVVKNGLVKRTAYWLEERCYKAASRIVTLSPGMTASIQSRYGLENIDTIYNPANLDLFAQPQECPADLEGERYAIYCGNIGRVNNVMWMVDAAGILLARGRDDIMLVFIGEGQLRGEVEKRKDAEDLRNLLVLGLMPKENLVCYVQNAMAALVPLANVPMLRSSSPNKFYESLSAGVPVVQSSHGWMRDFVKEHEVGFTVSAEDPASLADCLEEIADRCDPDIGRRARRTAELFFDENELARRMLESLRKASE